ncbi:MAG: GNAT family N-acetyltransferase [Nevskiaceae bacterium]|nr:MAG: GNAT family N-acetyltransferase [Nevskiaceae bacterium]TBR73136.1 MAG: GNAT family N-acetyltransferase [Nevskiaceae bacterium]
MDIEYKVNEPVTVDQFIDLLMRSTLGERRPIDDRECMAGMVANANLTVTARDAGRLVGVARSMTDFHYACYLSDLAVCRAHQRQGIGRQLLAVTQGRLGPRCKLILIAAPAANAYYEHLGFVNNSRCWILARDSRIHGSKE